MVRVEGLEPSRLAAADFHTTPYRYGRHKRCGLDYVFAISSDLGSWYIVSTHLGQ